MQNPKKNQPKQQFNYKQICLCSVASEIFALFVAGGLALIVWLTPKMVSLRSQFTIKHLIIATTVAAVACAVISQFGLGETVVEFVMFTMVFIIASAPTLAFVSFLRASIIVNRQPERSLVRIVWIWIAAWIAWAVALWWTWRSATIIMLDEYSNLPTTNPNCFITSAAAHGHREFVKSEITTASGGMVNRQMQRAKFLELTLLTSLPTSHRLIRKIYNRLGPPMAKVCRRNIWLADLTFLMFKPFEIMAWVLQKFLHIPNDDANKIYHQN